MDVQVGVFSATLPPEALEITRKFMNKPVRNKFPYTCHAAILHAFLPEICMPGFNDTGNN